MLYNQSSLVKTLTQVSALQIYLPQRKVKFTCIGRKEALGVMETLGWILLGSPLLGRICLKSEGSVVVVAIIGTALPWGRDSGATGREPGAGQGLERRVTESEIPHSPTIKIPMKGIKRKRQRGWQNMTRLEFKWKVFLDVIKDQLSFLKRHCGNSF